MESVIKEIKLLWPDCQIVKGSPRHSESNGGVERINQTVKAKIGAWMKETNSTHWSIGCKIVQWRYNTQVQQTLKDSPYHLTYGQHPHAGISNFPLAPAILATLSTEAQLQDVYLQMRSRTIGRQSDQTMAVAAAGIEGGSEFGRTMASIAQAVSAVETMAVSAVDVNLPTEEEAPMKKCRVMSTPKAKALGQGHHKSNTAKRAALAQAVIGDGALVGTADSDDGGDIVVSKSVGNSDAKVHWLELLKQHSNDFHFLEVSLKHIVTGRIGESFPIIRCINNKDISDPDNWKACILKKIRNDQFEVLDIHEQDKEDEDIDLEGDDGLRNIWTLYLKYPDDKFIAFFAALAEIVEDKK
jgi:hypothetical protein